MVSMDVDCTAQSRDAIDRTELTITQLFSNLWLLLWLGVITTTYHMNLLTKCHLNSIFVTFGTYSIHQVRRNIKSAVWKPAFQRLRFSWGIHADRILGIPGCFGLRYNAPQLI